MEHHPAVYSPTPTNHPPPHHKYRSGDVEGRRSILVELGMKMSLDVFDELDVERSL